LITAYYKATDPGNDPNLTAGPLSVTGTVATGQTLTFQPTPTSGLPTVEVAITIGKVINARTLNNQVTVTTKDPYGVLDGPTLSPVFTLTKVKTPMIQNNAITAAKISPSFMKFVQLNDDSAGHAAGWDPDGIQPVLVIDDTNVKANSMIFVHLANNLQPIFCGVIDLQADQFTVSCAFQVPTDGSTLRYVIITP